MKTRTTACRSLVGILHLSPPRFGFLNRLAAAGFVILFAAEEVHAMQTWHVASATGLDSNDGRTPTTAFASIQRAIDSAAWGDRILVGDGVYEPISTTNMLLEIESINGAAKTIIDGRGETRAAIFGGGYAEDLVTNTCLRGFTIRSGYAGDVGGGIVFGTAVSCIIENNTAGFGAGSFGGVRIDCVFSGNHATSEGGAMYDGKAKHCVMTNNGAENYGGAMLYGEAFDCTMSGNEATYGGAMFATVANMCVVSNNTACLGGGGYRATFSNCLFVANSASQYGGVGCYSDYDHCTFYANHAECGGAIYAGMAANCIFFANTSDSEASGADAYGADVSYSLIGGIVANSGDGTGVIVGDPAFVSAAERDFHLQSTSPCVDAGNPVFLAGGSDLDGNPRVCGERTDMGAYEFIPEPVEEDPPVMEGAEFIDIWGEWSSEDATVLSMPSSVSSWDHLAHALWDARDSFVRSGTATEVPPSTNAIVLAVGAVSVPGSMLEVNGVDWPVEKENGVTVVRAHFRESVETGELVIISPGGETAVSQLPSYLVSEWVKSTYGEAPAWLSSAEKKEWVACRARSRIEWMATLVPESSWAQYAAAREADISTVEADAEGSDIFRLTALSASDSDSAHCVSVQSSSGGIVRLLGKESLSGPFWEYKGLSIQERGTSAAGAVSEAKSQFFMATRQSVENLRRGVSALGLHPGDSDGDGIPDDIERLVLGTDPHSADTSGDGLSDWDKAYRYDLNPTVRDTAGDGISDAEKIASGSDPRVTFSPAQSSAASHSIRYTYDEDDRLTGTWFGLGGASTTTDLTPAGNPNDIRDREAAR